MTTMHRATAHPSTLEVDQVCSAEFAEWLIWQSEASYTGTNGRGDTIRVHLFGFDDMGCWECTEAFRALGYMPTPERFYVTVESRVTGFGTAGPFLDEDNALQWADALTRSQLLQPASDRTARVRLGSVQLAGGGEL